MATTSAKCLLIIVLTIATKFEILIEAQQRFPCLFFFGDSLLDNGNNNRLITIAKANYPPYGIDYPEGPTGRFSNGNNIADSLAKMLGFADPIPPFATARGSDFLRGVNYASAVAGILDLTGIQVGDRISMNKQLKNHQVTIDRISDSVGNRTAADAHLRQCLYVINIANEDYVNNYYFPLSPTPALYTPPKFAELLVQTFSQQLKSLYKLGSRRVAVFGLTKLGCVPQELRRYPTNGSACVESINGAVAIYNNKLDSAINDLNTDLRYARFTFINVTAISPVNPTTTGTRVNNASCCEVTVTGLCAPKGNTCSNRNDYFYYDNYHPTELVYNIFASKAYNAIAT